MAEITIGLELQNSAGKTPIKTSSPKENPEIYKNRDPEKNKQNESHKEHVTGVVGGNEQWAGSRVPENSRREGSHSRGGAALITHETPLPLTLYLPPALTLSYFLRVRILL